MKKRKMKICLLILFAILEAAYGRKACPPGFFACDNGRCIYESFVCDGDNDCYDWSDESEKACPCADDEVRCSMPEDSNVAGGCIPPEWICDEDGISDCPLGDDEANCTRTATSHKVSYKKIRVTLFKSPKSKIIMKKSKLNKRGMVFNFKRH